MTEAKEAIRLTADVVALTTDDDGRLCVLLIKRGRDPYAGCWAFPGGHVDHDEETHDAARRELMEETGLRAGEITLIGAYAKPNRDPRGRYVTFAYATVLDGPPPVLTAMDDAVDARWFPVRELSDNWMAFDHGQIVRDAVCATWLDGPRC